MPKRYGRRSGRLSKCFTLSIDIYKVNIRKKVMDKKQEIHNYKRQFERPIELLKEDVKIVNKAITEKVL